MPRDSVNTTQLLERYMAALSVDSTHSPKLKERRKARATPAGHEDMRVIAERVGKGLYKKIVVMSGAGISTASGLPDFRSPGKGLYENLQKYQLEYPEMIFEMDLFKKNSKPFFTLAEELWPDATKYHPNRAHFFVRLLEQKKVLLRNFTQNIDSLERVAGVSPPALVEAHGTFKTAKCVECNKGVPGETMHKAVRSGRAHLLKCKLCNGPIKPNIVFFGEDLPACFHKRASTDFSRCDLLIVMGTSLQVEPFGGMTEAVCATVPRLLFNRELVGPFKYAHNKESGRVAPDVGICGEINDSLLQFVNHAGWGSELAKLEADYLTRLESAASE